MDAIQGAAAPENHPNLRPDDVTSSQKHHGDLETKQICSQNSPSMNWWFLRNHTQAQAHRAALSSEI